MRKDGGLLPIAMQPDIEKYWKYVKDFDLTHEQKVELIHTVCRIMEAVVDQAFGVHPAQQIGRGPQRSPSPPTKVGIKSFDQIISDEFASGAQGPAGKELPHDDR